MGSHSDSAPRGARAPKNAQLPPKLFSPQPGRAVPPLHSEPHSWSWGPRPPAQLENLPPGSFQPSDLNSPLPPAGPSLPQVYRAGQLHPQEQPLKQGPPQIPPGQLPLTHPGRAPQPPTPTSCRDPGASFPLTLPNCPASRNSVPPGPFRVKVPRGQGRCRRREGQGQHLSPTPSAPGPAPGIQANPEVRHRLPECRGCSGAAPTRGPRGPCRPHVWRGSSASSASFPSAWSLTTESTDPLLHIGTPRLWENPGRKPRSYPRLPFTWGPSPCFTEGGQVCKN